MTDPKEPESKPKGWHPVYIAWKTLESLGERMRKEGVPARIDKSYLDTFAGSYQTQVIAALTAIGFRDETTGAVLRPMLTFVNGDEAERKQVIGQLLNERYNKVLARGTNATQQQMLEAFREMGVSSPDTMRKVVAFFLNAAKYAGITVSRLWKVPPVSRSSGSGGSGGTGKSTRNMGGANGGSGAGSGTANPPAPPAGVTNVKSVTLGTGGPTGSVVTLTLAGDLFAMGADDRQFVLDIVDKMAKHQDQRSLPRGDSVAPSAGADADLVDDEETVDDDFGEDEDEVTS